MQRVTTIALACAAALTLSSVRARAAPPPAPAPSRESARDREAIELFERSRERYREGKFQEAAELVRKAYALTPDPVLLYNLGRALEGAGDLARAVEAYEAYLRASPHAIDRLAVEERCRTLRAQMAERERLERERAEALRREEKARSEAGKPAAPWLPWAIGGVAAGALGAGATFGLMSSSARQSAVEEPVQETAQRDLDRAETFATVANIAFVAGAVLAITAVTVGLVQKPSARKPSALGPMLLGGSF